MEIPSNFRPLDPLARKRADEARQAKPSPGQSGPERSDAVSTSDTNKVVANYVSMLQAHSRDSGQLEALRQQLADGTFTADPEELADGLLDRIDDA